MANELATCPNCYLEFPDRDAKTEPIYTCVECGAKGYDCCIPGNNSVCANCEESGNGE